MEEKEIKARRLMQEIQYCNGMVNRFEPEAYPQEWVDKIAPIANKFFELHSHLYDDENIENICDGEYGENQELYGSLEGYKELDEVLGDYFENH